MERQSAFDFDRAEQLCLLREAILPDDVRTRRGVVVSPAVLKGVLRTIDDHGGGRESWPSYETIARETNCSVSTAKRAVECLEGLSLLCVQTRKARTSNVVCNHYRIVWSELALRCPGRTVSTAAAAPQSSIAPLREIAPSAVRAEATPEPSADRAKPVDRSVMTRDRSVMTRDRSVMTRDRSVIGDTQSALKRTEAQPPPPTPSEFEEVVGGAVKIWRDRKCSATRSVLEELHRRGMPVRDAVAELERLWQIASHPLNRGKLRNAGAGCMYHALNGAWPPYVEMVEDLAAMAAAQAKAAAATDSRRRDAEDYEVARLVRTLRRDGASDAAIENEINRRGLSAASERLGWREPPAGSKTSA